MKQILGLTLVDGKIVVVAKAVKELDHGKEFWLCVAYGVKPVYQPATDEKEAMEWMRKEGAESFFGGSELY